MKYRPVVMALLFAWAATLHAADKPYVYKHSAGQPRRMEIYFPPNHEPSKVKVPGMILFHSGAWLGAAVYRRLKRAGRPPADRPTVIGVGQ